MSNDETLFSHSIFPCFPFAHKEWMAIAFERDNYNNTRLPEWFFVAAYEEFAHPRSMMSIKGYGERYGGSSGGSVDVPFDWDAYRVFMQDPENYSPEYKMQGEARNWAFWADPEISVWGGDAVAMERIFGRIGGKGHVFTAMLKDFHISDLSANHELQGYLRSLVFRPVQKGTAKGDRGN